MKSKQVLFALLAFIGAALVYLGGFVFTAEATKAISGLSVGFGSATFALGAGWLAQSLLASVVEDDKIKRFKAIEVNDERNVRIREKSGHMVAKVMNYVLCAFALSLVFLNVDMLIILLAVSLIVIEFILSIVFSNYYEKRM
jgi:uncharacterized membrane protein